MPAGAVDLQHTRSCTGHEQQQIPVMGQPGCYYDQGNCWRFAYDISRGTTIYFYEPWKTAGGAGPYIVCTNIVIDSEACTMNIHNLQGCINRRIYKSTVLDQKLDDSQDFVVKSSWPHSQEVHPSLLWVVSKNN